MVAKEVVSAPLVINNVLVAGNLFCIWEIRDPKIGFATLEVFDRESRVAENLVRYQRVLIIVIERCLYPSNAERLRAILHAFLDKCICKNCGSQLLSIMVIRLSTHLSQVHFVPLHQSQCVARHPCCWNSSRHCRPRLGQPKHKRQKLQLQR